MKVWLSFLAVDDGHDYHCSPMIQANIHPTAERAGLVGGIVMEATLTDVPLGGLFFIWYGWLNRKSGSKSAAQLKFEQKYEGWIKTVLQYLHSKD